MVELLALILGTLGYLTLKFFGYALYARFLNRLYQHKANIWKVGFFKVAVGVFIGVMLNVAVGYALHKQYLHDRNQDAFLYFIELAAFRVLEWTFIIWYFYDRTLHLFGKLIIASIFGTLLSFVLDLYIPLTALGVVVAMGGIC